MNLCQAPASPSSDLHLVSYGLNTNVLGSPGGSVLKNLPSNAGDMGLLPELGRSSGEGNGSPLQYSRLGISMHRGAWQTIVHGVAKSQIPLKVQTTTNASSLLDLKTLWRQRPFLLAFISPMLPSQCFASYSERRCALNNTMKHITG